MTTAVEVADLLYARWNADGLSVVVDSVDPSVELVCDPLQPAESSLRGVEGWREWAARWEQRYEHVHIDVHALVPMDGEHVLALVTINATPTGAGKRLSCAAAHVWTVREGRVTGWETHVDIAAARRTLEA
jgi:ketosteroid isomerase-like protein